jgi:hypothetical protein
MNRCVNGIAWIEGVSSGECLSDHHFIVAAGFGKPSGAEEKEIRAGASRFTRLRWHEGTNDSRRTRQMPSEFSASRDLCYSTFPPSNLSS